MREPLLTLLKTVVLAATFLLESLVLSTESVVLETESFLSSGMYWMLKAGKNPDFSPCFTNHQPSWFFFSTYSEYLWSQPVSMVMTPGIDCRTGFDWLLSD